MLYIPNDIRAALDRAEARTGIPASELALRALHELAETVDAKPMRRKKKGVRTQPRRDALAVVQAVGSSEAAEQTGVAVTMLMELCRGMPIDLTEQQQRYLRAAALDVEPRKLRQPDAEAWPWPIPPAPKRPNGTIIRRTGATQW
jgi:hypothetical protein